MLLRSLRSVSVRHGGVFSRCCGTAGERILWRYGARLIGSAFLWALLCACLVMGPQARAALAWSSSSVVGGTFQDGERNYRQPSVAQSLQGGERRGILLPEDAHNPRKNKIRTALADNAVPLAKPDSTAVLEPEDWRIKVRNAAIARGDQVLLGDIGEPLGQMSPERWQALSTQPLWPAPAEEGKPMQISRSRLSLALRQVLGKEVSGRCILPSSLVIQRGGLLFTEDDLRDYVIRSLGPHLAAMPGQAELTDFRLPEYIFLSHSQQRVQLEVGKLSPGRVTLRFAVQEADGTVIRRVSGLANLVLWVTLPAAARPLNKGENLSPDAVTFIRFNASQLRGVPWDGQGGPWQTTRSLTTGDPILQSDLASQLMVRRGDVVKLIFKRGNVQMETHAEALSDGEPGGTIAVRNLQTKKQVYGIVQDGNTVIIR